MGPTAPNFSGETTPHMGPNNSPMIKSHSTSGIFVRAKKRGKPVRQKDGTADKYYGERGWHILYCDPPSLKLRRVKANVLKRNNTQCKFMTLR